MEPRNIGRALGIGVRVAGRIAGQRIASPAPSGASPARPKAQSVAPAPRLVSPAPPQAQAARRIAAQTGPNLSKGIGGLLRPFRRVGGIVWLEVTGTFFLLFAAVFALRLWQNWSGIGEVSRDFSIGAAVVFLYLGISSFWRARRR
ncbi:MAG: hypothetical protein WCF30_08415 [Terracidiphilus sp.]